MKQNVIEKLKNWAEVNGRVKAVVLTSSRASDLTATVDQFSDYDVCLYVDSLVDFKDDTWLLAFGKPLVWWPQNPQSTFDENWLTRLVIFEDRVRIDFQITSKEDIVSSEYDLGYQVLIDKVGLTNTFPNATKSKHFICKPTQQEFLTLLNDFFWDATYVVKYLWRNELFYAKFMLDFALRFEYFEKMIEWHIGIENDWKVSTNIHGRHFQKYLGLNDWEEIKQTFAGHNIEENWEAFFKMVEIFTKYARQIAESLSYEYPSDQERKMLEYYQYSKCIGK